MSSKLDWIIFEGVDGAGKTTLIEAVHKATNFKYPMIDRSFITSWVYAKLFAREIDIQKYEKLEKEMLFNFNVLVVYCYGDKNILIERMKQKNENESKIVLLDDVLKLYEKYFASSCLEIIKIDTTKINLQESLELILNKIKEIENNNDVEFVDKKLNKLLNNGEYVDIFLKKTLEARNVRYKLCIDADTINALRNKSDNKVLDKENTEYTRMKVTLDVKKQENISDVRSRRIVYSGDTCLSLIQLLNRTTGVEVYFYFRSSDIEKHFTDVFAICEHIFEEYGDFKLFVVVGSLHKYL